jgi:biopolymer transport protein ExbD
MSRARAIAPTFSHATLGVFPLVLASLVFVLLIILLVGTPIFSHGRPLLLPTVASPTPYLDGGDLVHISVLDDGMVFIENRWYPLPELPRALAKAVLRAPRVPGAGLVLSLDRDLRFSTVRRLLRLLADAGATRVILKLEQTPAEPFQPGT